MRVQHIWSHNATGEALRIVRDIIYTNPTPLTVHQLYRLAVRVPAATPTQVTNEQAKALGHDGPVPPHPEHPIRSMSYLKKSILPTLAERKEIQKIKGTVTLSDEEREERIAMLAKSSRKEDQIVDLSRAWVWRPMPKLPEPKPEPVKQLYGTEVGAGADWSHLNKRRRRAREEKVARDIGWMRMFDRERQQTVPKSP